MRGVQDNFLPDFLARGNVARQVPAGGDSKWPDTLSVPDLRPRFGHLERGWLSWLVGKIRLVTCPSTAFFAGSGVPFTVPCSVVITNIEMSTYPVGPKVSRIKGDHMGIRFPPARRAQ